jgi:hypothetical protein
MAKEIWQRYADIWRMEAPQAAAEMDACMEPAIRYSDPNISLAGFKELADYMATFRRNYPGYSFAMKAVSEHHGFSLARWNILDPKGLPVSAGISFGVFSANIKFIAIAGFYGDIGDILG